MPYYAAMKWVSIDDRPGKTVITVITGQPFDTYQQAFEVAKERSDVTDAMHEPEPLVLTEAPGPVSAVGYRQTLDAYKASLETTKPKR